MLISYIRRPSEPPHLKGLTGECREQGAPHAQWGAEVQEGHGAMQQRQEAAEPGWPHSAFTSIPAAEELGAASREANLSPRWGTERSAVRHPSAVAGC